ncbi:MAG TPA: hypothetical protein VFD32_17390, partial [Dehalococcoidia bacterium]|nr:hypothetical protein [Dehalococcoidia bacterium]
MSKQHGRQQMEASAMDGYWSEIRSRRFSRRSALQTGSIFTLGLAAIAAGACSSNNNKKTANNGGATGGNSAASTASAGNPPPAGKLFNTADQISLAP